ncbi:ATP-dependent Clp protease proteolytic subunit [Azospirillum sp. B4]|uniref:ATP-dependent Clp protease proteolytic subunit n=1 Tax=Azospirillum sp. B4 TaxID=95605 RepID=UPI00034DA3AC|nr:ATP-dependent Clp protease proteolytic subunit [Azospirillum sp. B4]
MEILVTLPIRFDDEEPDDAPESAPEGGKEEKSKGAPFSPVAQSLFKSRTVLIFGEINQKIAESTIAQLLALAAEGDDPIRLVINSQGGHVESGDSIHDILQFIRPRVLVLGTGWVASAGAHIFLGAAKENRYCLPNTRFLIHQPMGGTGGQATDIAIEAREIVKMRKRLNTIIARETGQPLEKIEQDTDRNFWMSAEEAKDYGIVTHIISKADDLK